MPARRRCRRARRLVVALCAAALGCSLAPAASDDAETAPVILGPLGGDSPYGVFARYLQGALTKGQSAERRHPVDTEGSSETLLRLDAMSEPAVGIVQADALYHFLRGGHPQFAVARPESGIRALSRLFPEWVHVYAPAPSRNALRVVTGALEHAHARRADLLAGADTVCGGAVGTGDLVTAMNLGHVLDNHLHLLPCSFEQYERNAPPFSWDREIRTARATGAPAAVPPFFVEVRSPGYRPNTSTPRRVDVGLDEATAYVLAASHPEVYDVVTPEALAADGKTEPLLRKAPKLHRATVSVDAILVANSGLSQRWTNRVLTAVCCLQAGCGGRAPAAADCPHFDRAAAGEVYARTSFCDVAVDPGVCGGVWSVGSTTSTSRGRGRASGSDC
jgi:hypothetical protein